MVTVVTIKIGVLKHRHHRHPSSPGCAGTAHPLEESRQGRTSIHCHVRAPFASLRSGQGQRPCATVRLTQFQGGNPIDKTREQLQQELTELETRIRQHRNRLQRLEQRAKHIAKGERQKRAHRLITRGAAVESVAPTVRGMSESEFYELIERIFELPEVQVLLPKGGE